MNDYLSLSNCDASSEVWPWNALTVPLENQYPKDIVYGHEAITAVFDETEWMIISGGLDASSVRVPDFSDSAATPDFHVWMMNLTHADLYGEASWFLMTSNHTNAYSPDHVDNNCPPFVSNATDDPWHRADLWHDAVACAPTPRQGHLTTVVNGYLYVFGGFSFDDTIRQFTPPDNHVYRIALHDVLANSWSSWRRILPRGFLGESMYNATVSHVSHLEGGLWQEYPKSDDLPKLVVFAQIQFSTLESLEPTLANQIWLYNFAEDGWEMGGDLDGQIDVDIDDYTVIVVRDWLIVVGRTIQQYSWVDLRTMLVDCIQEALEETTGLPTQSLVTYETIIDDELASVIVGTDPRSSWLRLKAANLVVKSWGGVDVDFVSVNGQEDKHEPSSYPQNSEGHSTVLSLAGYMYFFGGLDSQSVVWQVNVGGPTCALDIAMEQFGDGPCQYDCVDGSDPAALSKLLPLFIFFPMVFWICGHSDRQSPAEGDRTASSRLDSVRGLSPEQMETFPQRIFGENKDNDDDDGDDERVQDNNDVTMCSICLVDFNYGDQVRDLPCKHFFHLSCVDSWLRSESTCPLCRESCRPAVDAREREQQQHQRSGRPPFVLTRIIALLRGDTRERGYVLDGDDNDGLELGSIYALELQEDREGDDDNDDVSVLSNFSSSVRTTVSHRSGEPLDEGMERRRQRQRRGAPRGGGEGSVPLTAVSDSAMV